MTTLISKDERELLEMNDARAIRMDDGDMVISAPTKEIDMAGEWMGRHGVSGVSFDPSDDVDEYTSFMFVCLDNGHTAIRLY